MINARQTFSNIRIVYTYKYLEFSVRDDDILFQDGDELCNEYDQNMSYYELSPEELDLIENESVYTVSSKFLYLWYCYMYLNRPDDQ